MKTFMLSAEPFRLITIATIAALTLTCSSASIAGDDGHVPQTIVRFGDLSPGTAQGAARLYRRIVAAAYEVCSSFDRDIRDNLALAQREECVHAAVSTAVIKVGQPELIAVYNANHREHLPVTVAVAQTR